MRIAISPGDIAYNLGDEAIVSAIIQELEKRGHTVAAVFSRAPARTQTRNQFPCYPIIPKTTRDLAVMNEVDLLIWGCGNQIQDETSIFLFPFFSIRALQAILMRIPVILFAAGVGPLKHKLSKKLAYHLVRQCKLCTVRDMGALNALRHCGVESDVYMTGDPAFLLKEERQIGTSVERHGIVFAVREWFVHNHRIFPRSVMKKLGLSISTSSSKKLLRTFADAADRFADSGFSVTFLPMSTDSGNNDFHLAHEIVSSMRNKAQIFKSQPLISEVFDLLNQAELVVAHRMHAAILSLIAGCKLVLITYGHKGEAMMNHLGLQQWSLRVEECNGQEIFAKGLDLIASNESVDIHLAAGLHSMRVKASKTFDLLEKYLQASCAHSI